MTPKKQPLSANYVVPAKWTIGAIISLIVISGSSVAFFISQKNHLELEVMESKRISTENNAMLKNMVEDDKEDAKLRAATMRDIEQRQDLFEVRLVSLELTIGLSQKK